jgi:hypothetical protein
VKIFRFFGVTPSRAKISVKMLRLASVFLAAASLLPGASATSDLQLVLADDNLAADARRVRVAFRGDTDEVTDSVASYSVQMCNVVGQPKGPVYNQLSGVKGQKKDRVPTGTGGMAAYYNATTGIQTIVNRGGYGEGEDQTLVLDGPGTLYTVHLDIEPRDDYIEIIDQEGHTVKLTGNYSACIRHRTGGYGSSSLETTYMDKNLAPGTMYSESIGDYHTTEETQNHQDDLCHNILTGKVLMPDPVKIGGPMTTLRWVSDGFDMLSGNDPNANGADDPGSHSTAPDYFDGFELLMAFNDLYTADVSSDDPDATHVCLGGESIAVQDKTGMNGALPPSGTAPHVYFKDLDLNKLKISGLVEIQSASMSTETSYTIILEKFEPAGRWGYIMGQLANDAEFSQTERSRDGTPYGESTVYGPRDTWGHEGAELPYYPTGGSTGTEAPRLTGGGPAGARVFNKHGDVIPGSARGMHPDYQAAEELIDVQAWQCDCGGVCSVSLDGRCQKHIARQSGEPNGAGLQRSQGSPPAPMYQLRVRSCDSGNCNMRDSTVIQLIDIAEYEPDGKFYGDLDPKTRVLQGMITVITPAYAMGIRGYRAYPTNDGTNNLPLVWSDSTAREQEGRGARSPNPQFIHILDKHCPPDDTNTDQMFFCDPSSPENNKQWCALSQEACGNDNPYSPKCLGKSCAFVNILPGSAGEFYITRYDNLGNAENPQTAAANDPQSGKLSNLPKQYTSNTGQRNYSHNEYAEIYIPKSGWLTPIMMDVNTAKTTAGHDAVGAGDTLILYDAPDSFQADLVAQPLSVYIDLPQEESLIVWTTDEYDTAHGFTLIFQPNYPEIMLNTGTPMAQGASGQRMVPVYHANPTLTPLTDLPSDGANGEIGEGCQDCDCVGCASEGTTNTDCYVETYDWLVPNVTCTPTTMHCPLPMVWAHINYTTPSLYPEPAEGSCLQQKTGTSSLHGCGDKMNLDKRWYSGNSPTTVEPGNSLQNTDEEDNEQSVAADVYTHQYNSWAGNCGDASSYFWFEKISCGSTRTFHTDRSLIEDHVQLTPTWEDIQAILDLYYTTKAPLAGADGSVGFTFITDDYHIPPVLPPKINCTCHASMDAYASLLSVVSKTPTPGAPVTLDPEVLNSGTSKIVATLRMYQDPTYSIPASSVAPMPIVVTRFYLEVSTKFTRNRITISDCTASVRETFLNMSSALKPRQNYCDNSTFDTQTERSPNGVTHMDRISMKKFKFQTSTDVFVQCKIRACAQQPCGVCTGYGAPRNLEEDVDLDPGEGEMWAPPFGVKLSPFDNNALVFGDPVADNGWEESWTSSVSSEDGSSVGTVSSGSGGGGSAARKPDDPSHTTKPIQIAASLVLADITASWAIQNRQAVADTLRATLALTEEEELVLTRISKFGGQSSKAGRQLDEEERQLQSASGDANVRIDYVIGVTDPKRAEQAEETMSTLSSGSAAMIQTFAQVLDEQLVKRGKAPAKLSPKSFRFSAPKKTVKTEEQMAASQAAAEGNTAAGAQPAVNQLMGPGGVQVVEKSSDDGTTTIMMGGVLGVLALAVLGTFLYTFTKKSDTKEAGTKKGEEDAAAYASKVAMDDNQWQNNGGAAAGSTTQGSSGQGSWGADWGNWGSNWGTGGNTWGQQGQPQQWSPNGQQQAGGQQWSAPQQQQQQSTWGGQSW